MVGGGRESGGCPERGECRGRRDLVLLGGREEGVREEGRRGDGGR